MSNHPWAVRVEFSEFTIADMVERLQRESEVAQRIAQDVLGAGRVPSSMVPPRRVPDTLRAHDGRPSSDFAPLSGRPR